MIEKPPVHGAPHRVSHHFFAPSWQWLNRHYYDRFVGTYTHSSLSLRHCDASTHLWNRILIVSWLIITILLFRDMAGLFFRLRSHLYCASKMLQCR